MHERNAGPGPSEEVQAVAHLKGALSEGREWVPALLEAIALWTLPEEVFKGRRHRYLLNGEAFDWLLLAERLLAEVDDQVSEEEKRELLFSDDPSESVSMEEFKRLLGPEKYNAYLNYWYGVVVEDAIIRCAKEEEWKRTRSRGLRVSSGVTERAYLRVYGLGHKELLQKFRETGGHPAGPTMTPTQAKEFTYWLFKYRIEHSDGARVASDTHKAIIFLQRVQSDHGG